MRADYSLFFKAKNIMIIVSTLSFTLRKPPVVSSLAREEFEKLRQLFGSPSCSQIRLWNEIETIEVFFGHICCTHVSGRL